MKSRRRSRVTADIQVIPDPRTGAPAYAVVPIADYEALIAAAEDREDVAAAAAARARLAAGGESFPLDLLKAVDMGLNSVRAFREYRELSQAELARRAGVRQATVSDVEGGKFGTVVTMVRIARALDVDLELLVPESPE